MRKFLKIAAIVLGTITGMTIAFVSAIVAILCYHWFNVVNEAFMIGFTAGCVVIGGTLGGIAANNLIVKRWVR